MARRPKGDGSLFKTQHNGHPEWCACWNQNGKRHRTYGLTKSEALSKKQKMIARLALPEDARVQKASHPSTVGTKSNPTVEEFMERWLKNIAEGHPDNVIAQYRRNLTNHILPTVGDRPIKKISDADIMEIQESLTKKGVGPAAKAHTFREFSQLMNYGVKVKVLRRNPFQFVALPKPKTQVARLDEQLIDFRVSSAKDMMARLKDPEHIYHDAYPLIQMMFLGLRARELCGLEWSCFSLPNKTLLVKQQLKKEVGGPFFIFEKTKNKKSREIPLYGDFLAAVIEEMGKNRKQKIPIYTEAGKEVSDLMFIDEDGNPITYHRLYASWEAVQKEYFTSMGQDYETYRWRPHYNRHIAASLLAKKHVPLGVAQQILGHLDPATTEWYQHIFSQDLKAGAAALAGEFEEDPWEFAQHPESSQHINDMIAVASQSIEQSL